MMQQPDAANAVVATTITLGGIATGLSYEVLLAGFAGGLVSLSFLPPMGLWRRIWTPVTATLTAGYTAPLGVYYLSGVVGEGVEHLSLQVFAAFGIGVLAQVGIPAVLRIARRRFDNLNNLGDHTP